MLEAHLIYENLPLTPALSLREREFKHYLNSPPPLFFVVLYYNKAF